VLFVESAKVITSNIQEVKFASVSTVMLFVVEIESINFTKNIVDITSLVTHFSEFLKNEFRFQRNILFAVEL
jgi:hypothetical protein